MSVPKPCTVAAISGSWLSMPPWHPVPPRAMPAAQVPVFWSGSIVEKKSA